MTLLDTPWPPPVQPVSPDVAAVESAPRRSRRNRRLSSAVALVLIVASLLIDRSGLFIVPLLFVFVVPFEKMFPRHRGQRIRRPGLGVDIAHALAAPVLAVAGLVVAIGVGIASLAWVPGLLLRPVVALIPSVALPFVGIALFDLAIYWVHRWSHEVPILWKFHAVHHSTEHLDWVSGLRNHPFDGAIAAPPFFLLIAAGFDATFTGALALVQLIAGLFLHANVRWRLKPLHRLVVTPEFHHWHHADEHDAHNSNYSVFLPVWDTLFGTYFMPEARRPARYGISEPMPVTLLGQLRYPLRDAPALGGIVAHPISSTRALGRWTRRLSNDIWRSTRRPVRH